ncbi:IclR family transcriptional regulator [Alicyclobacillus fastidiosus]|uniref:IclR family transcriptional regulator n=2 Tax=Alicyclobacillus fastidiosus TaxID=392011 RepID=A0ABY6ZCV9_9BACL|nr:IclR family transcriptional regulator [Alicyclobacillus fastidiosus]WAH39956.1 IclR family transcriptional regulator [Alicyclobacillus fastidiosus]
MAKEQPLSSVYNAIRILQEFSDDIPVMGVSELGERLGIAKSTVHRLLCTLRETGLVEQDSHSHKYRLGIGMFVIGSVFYRSAELRAKAFPILVDLMQRVRRIVRLGIYDYGSVVYLCKLPEDKETRTFSSIGTRVPCHSTAVGKLLLAFQSSEEIERVLSLPLKARTSNTMTDKDELLEQLGHIRAVRYALTSEESRYDVCSLAVPVYDESQHVTAALSITGSKSQFLPTQVQEFLGTLRMFSRLITEQLDGIE